MSDTNTLATISETVRDGASVRVVASTHILISELQARLHRQTGERPTVNDVITMAIIDLDKKTKKAAVA